MAVNGASSGRRTIRPSRPRDEREPHGQPDDDREARNGSQPVAPGPGERRQAVRRRAGDDRRRRTEHRDRPAATEPAARARRASGRVTSAGPAARAAVRQLAELTGRQPEGVTAVQPADDGWVVGVEVIEDRRIPSSADILAIYEALVTGDGDLVSYRRTRRYARGRGDDYGGGG